MSIKVTVDGLLTAKKELAAIGPTLERDVIRAMSEIAFRTVEAGAQRHTKTGGDGKLLASTYNRLIPGGREVGHDPQIAPHALFVLGGSRPHIIKPKNKKALRWVGGNGFIFASFVKHPGYIGDDYLNRAADDALRQFDAIVSAKLKEA